MGLRKHEHHPWEYFEQAAKWLYGIDSVVCIGGEPTSHPKFGEFAPKFRALFGCRELILWTNGFKAQEHAEALKCFDAVYATLYDDRTAPWLNPKKHNTEAFNFIKINYPNLTNEEPHVPRSHRGSGDICERGIHGPIAYADGKIYGCCVAVGLKEGIGVVPSDNWKQEVLATQLPCQECCFSPG